jgi:hypothetical protein
MKLLSGRETKKVDYFGIEFELDKNFKGFIKTHCDSWVFATELDWRGEFVSSTFLGVVDLEGMDWQDTVMEIN